MQLLTRRSILLLGSVAGMTALAAPSQAGAAPMFSHTASMIAARSSFTGAIGSTVTAISGAGRFRLKLLDILDVGPVEQFEPEQSFNLIFHTGRFGTMPDGIYRLGSARFPATTLLLTATGPAGRNHLQALINRSG